MGQVPKPGEARVAASSETVLKGGRGRLYTPHMGSKHTTDEPRSLPPFKHPLSTNNSEIIDKPIERLVIPIAS